MDSNFFSFRKLPRNSLSRQQQQPRLEGAPGRVVLELSNVLAHRNDRLLHCVLPLRVGQAGLARHAVNQLPVRVEELLPARMVVGVLQPVEQAASRRQEIGRVVGHGLCHDTLPV